jgi:hypothetical protein
MKHTSPGADPDTQRWERATLHALMMEWMITNEQLFDNALSPPGIALSDAEETLGMWHSNIRVISIQRDLIRKAKWVQVTDVLRHEMAHQYVDEVLRITQEPPHGPTFRRVCAARGIDGRGTVRVELSDEAQRLLKRIERLLALAQSENEHEATLAATQAQALITRYHLSIGGAPPSKDHDARADALGARQLGAPKGRHFEYEYAIAHLLRDHFFVECMWIQAFCVETLKVGRALEVCGRHEDLEISEYVYYFLTAQLERSWAAHAKSVGARGLRERLSYQLGVVRGFHSKLDAQREELLRAEERARDTDATRPPSPQALMLIGAQEVAEFFERRNPNITYRSGGDWRPSDEYSAGLSEGRALTLRKGLQEGPSHEVPLGLEHKR